MFYDKIHDGDIATYEKPIVVDFTHDPDNEEEDTDVKESATGDGDTQQDVENPDQGKPRSGKKSRARPKRDQTPVGTIPVQQPDGP